MDPNIHTLDWSPGEWMDRLEKVHSRPLPHRYATLCINAVASCYLINKNDNMTKK